MPGLTRTLTSAFSLLLALAGVEGRLAAQWTHSGASTSAYLVTAGPGGDFFTWFGHAAIIVYDSTRAREFWYDYGIIDGVRGANDARTGGIRARVVRRSNPAARIKALEDDDRSVVVQELLLSPSQRAELLRLLEADVRAYGRNGYAYRHIEDNCTTRIRDVIDRASGGALRRSASTERADRTIREHGYRRFVVRSMPFTMFADIVTGNAIDRPMTEWEAMFLPEELARHVGRARLESGEPLATERYRAESRHHVLPVKPPHHHLALALLGIAAGLTAVFAGWNAGRGHTRARAWLGVHASVVALLLGLPGFVIAIAWAATDLTFVHSNENVMLANPLVLGTLPVAIAFARGSANAARALRQCWSLFAALALLAVAAKLFPVFHQDNWRVIAVVLPMTTGLAVAFRLATPDRPVANRVKFQ